MAKSISKLGVTISDAAAGATILGKYAAYFTGDGIGGVQVNEQYDTYGSNQWTRTSVGTYQLVLPNVFGVTPHRTNSTCLVSGSSGDVACATCSVNNGIATLVRNSFLSGNCASGVPSDSSASLVVEITTYYTNPNPTPAYLV